MQVRRRYSFFSTIRWTSRYIFLFLLLDSVPVLLYHFFDWRWMHIPWQPISLIGIAVAFYLGFKNNSSYERLWEARKIWGGIVNGSRSFTVMVRDYVNNEERETPHSDATLAQITRTIVNRHIAWLHALAIELRKPKEWEHRTNRDDAMRELLGGKYSEEQFEMLKDYLSEEEYAYLMTKGNKSSHLISLQSKDLMSKRLDGTVEHFRHLALMELIAEFYTLQGKSERIKNYPFPRQYATVNYFFVVMFILLLPFGMMDIFAGGPQEYLIWLAIPFSVVGSWVFWTMEMIGDYSENPFEGLYNDVPIATMARGIEIDILQMLDEENLPAPRPATVLGKMKLEL